MTQTHPHSLSRRAMLLATTMAAASLGWASNSTWAKAPRINTQGPYFYRFAFGGAEATVVSDGPVVLPATTFVGVPHEEVQRMLARSFLPTDNVVFEQNILVLNTGDKLVMFDTGLGSMKLFGPGSGRMLNSLKQAGIDPKDIDAVVLSHAHPDHVWGVMADDGSPNFPNAQIYISQADYEFWTDEAKLSNKDLKALIEGARRHLLPNRSRIIFFKDGQEFLPGVQAMATPGHTVGHAMFMLSSGDKTLAVLGDTTHHPVLLFENPRMEFIYDTDPKQSVQSRVRVLEMLAAKRIPFLGYHFPWPGIGFASKHGDGFRYHPQPMQMLL
ncbi:MAG: MBL fold metallo-hydrolase [Hyphomonadaceae bacterium]|nr:MBL fold metallo-hydrolase [Hyphomonadaceae bacterium]